MDNWELALEFWSLELFVVLNIGGPDMGHRFQFWARKNMKNKFGSGRRCFRIQLGSGIYYLFTDLVLGNNMSRPGLGLEYNIGIPGKCLGCSKPKVLVTN